MTDPPRRAGAYGIVRRDDTVLLVYDQDDQCWYFPGGGIEPGESAEQALAREVAEETGFGLVGATFLAHGEQLAASGVLKEQDFFLAQVDDTDPRPDPEHELEWVPVTEADRRLAEDTSRRALALATPSMITATTPDLHDPVLPAEGTPHHQAALDSGVLHLVEVGGGPSNDRDGDLVVVAANLERGNHLDAWVEHLEALDADVVLLSEADGGMARSANRYVARELADRIGAEFAFVVEYVELGLGSPREREALPPGATNDFGVHGGAVLSRVGLDRPAAVRFDLDGAVWYRPDSREPRVGGRIAVLATVGDVVVVAPHLESHGSPQGRADQLDALLALVDTYAEGRPVIVGGDLNTHTLDATGGGERVDLTEERFLDPVPHEPLFEGARRHGYEWNVANAPGGTHRSAADRADARLDWFLVRGVEVRHPRTIPALDTSGRLIGDHDLLTLTVTLPV